MRNEYKIKGTIFIFIVLYFFACCISFSGCVSVDKATNVLKKKGKLAEVCATEYPVKDSTVYLPGDTITEVIEVPGDSLLVFDTVWRNQYQTKIDTIVLRCPPTRTVVKTVKDTVTVYRENTARVSDLTGKLAIEHAAHTKWKKKAEKRGQIIGYTFSFIGLALILFVLRLYLKMKGRLLRF